MKINKFEGRNWLTHHFVSFDFAGLAIVCGPNGSGKSSVGDGIAFAMMSELRRVTAKGDRDLLVTDGQTKGEVSLTCGGVRIARNVANGKLTTAEALPMPADAAREAVPFLLNAALFCSGDEEDRRALLYKLPGVDMNLSQAALKAELKKRGHAPARVDELDDALFRTWDKVCADKASEARGAWKAATGETYGGLKAANWAAPQPVALEGSDDITALRDRVFLLGEEARAAAERVGEIRAERVILAQKREELEGLERAHKHPDILRASAVQALINRDIAARAHETATAALAHARQHETVPALTCPHCAGRLTLDLAGTLSIAPPAHEGGGASKERIAALQTAVRTAKAELDTAETARAQADRAVAGSDETARRIQELEAEIAAYPATTAPLEEPVPSEELAKLREQIAAIEEFDRNVAAAEQTTKTAAAAHLDVLAWAELVIATGSSGVAAEMLAGGLKPINDMLRTCAEATGWPQVTIDAGMRVKGGGRLYGLMCESEKWRVDTMMAVTIAIMSKMQFVLLDRLDVLDLPNRSKAIHWLYALTQAQKLDTVILMGTLKEPPKAPPGVSVHWMGAAPQAAAVAA